MNLSGYMMGILAAWVLAAIFNAALCQIMFKTKRVSMKILRAASCIGAILGLLIILWFLSRDETILFFCPAWVMFAASGVYLLLYYLLCRKRIKRQKVKFFDLIKDEVREEFPNEMEKKFEKAKRKSLRKGKGELSLEAFLEKEEKDVRLTEKMDIFYYVLPLVITAGGFIPTYLNDGFESFLDTIIYVVVMLAIEYPLMLAFAKIGKNGTRERKRWIAAKREEMKQGEMEKEEVR